MKLPIHASAAETVTFTTSSFTATNCWYGPLFVTVSAITGTTPTLVVKIQESADNVNWADVPSYTTSSITSTGTVRISAPNNQQACADYVRAVCTIGGTTPSVTFSAWVCTVPSIGW